MSERIPVIVRVRPPTEAEQKDSKLFKCSPHKTTVNDKTFPLPGFGPDVSTEKLYTDYFMSLVLQGISRGIDVGILCLGQSKSGKSHSLASSSPSTQQGLVGLTADSVFGHVERLHYFVGVSYLNIFQEKFSDLLNPADQDIKVKSHPIFGQYFEELSEIRVKSKADLMRLFDQGNKVRKILELEQNIPCTKSHAILRITCEHKTAENRLVRSQVFFLNVAGLNHSKDHDVSNSLTSLQSVVLESGAAKKQSGHVGSKLTMILKPLMDKSSYLGVVGHISPCSQSLSVTTKTIDLLMKLKEVEVEPKSRTIDPQELITELRKRVSASRNNVMAQNSGKVPKEEIAELESSMAALSAVKRLQWPERERASNLAEEQRTQTLADKGVLEWITETTPSNTSSSVLLLQRDKDKLLAEYKTQRKTVDTLKSELQSRINSHTALSEQPHQTENVLQESLAGIHTLRDQLKTANERLKELKRDVKDTQDKLRTERSSDPQKAGEVSGNFTLTLMMKRDELNHLMRDNKLFLDEEKERIQSEADQEVAELRLSASQGAPPLTLEQITALQEKDAEMRAQLSHLALHVQCLQAEKEKLSETVEALNLAHQSETESQRARNLLTFRQFKDLHEEQTAVTKARYQELVNACVQDSVFLSSKNAEISEENSELKRKLKHFR